MDFGDQFKKTRSALQLTQEQVATMLNVTRQAVSNWEKNKNLPDIEMIVIISRTFKLSLDQLILGDGATNNLTEKLIRDGSETRRARINLISICIGVVLLFVGLVCFIIKANSTEYIDADGMLQEEFFLLPIAFLLIFCGVIVFFVTGVRNIIMEIKSKRMEKHIKEAEKTHN